MAALLPSDFGTQAAYSTYYLALPDSYTPVKPNMTAFETAEMLCALALVPRPLTTKLFAVNSGLWNVAGNWYPNGVPIAGDRICIGEGVVVTLATVQAPKLFTIRIDGTLQMDPTTNASLLFDTIVCTPTGMRRNGTSSVNVLKGVLHEWIIATSNGIIDVTGVGAFSGSTTVYGNGDTFFQSRGIIDMGQRECWGHKKTEFAQAATPAAPLINALNMTLDQVPVDWEIGDEVVIAATFLQGDTNNLGYYQRLPERNDRRTLTSVVGNTIGWATGLTYDHTGPATASNRLDLKAYVINLTRNVRTRPDLKTAPIHHRGHTMFMHNPANIKVRYEQFADLGRTSKTSGIEGAMVPVIPTSGTAGVPIDLTTSKFWNGVDGISLGPTFSITMNWTLAPVAGHFTVVGLGEDGLAISYDIAYPVGEVSNPLITNQRFLKVTSITPSTNLTRIGTLQIEARGRQRNELGVRGWDIVTLTQLPYVVPTNIMNIQGRYPVHFHKMGLSGAIMLNPPLMAGCSIHGSQGWLIAHHQTHCTIKDTVGFDAVGAGIVGEDGNETGEWINCVMIQFRIADDNTFKGGVGTFDHDPALGGFAYFMAGRNVRMLNCVAIAAFGGFVFNIRAAYSLQVPSTELEFSTSRNYSEFLAAEVVPIAHFKNNSAIACDVGFHVVKANPNQLHDARSLLTGFKAWSVYVGFQMAYVAHYNVSDLDVVRGNVSLYSGSPPSTKGFDISDSNAMDIAIVNPKLEGLSYGLFLSNNASGTGLPNPESFYWVVNKNCINCTTDMYVRDLPTTFEYATSSLNPAPVSLTNLTVTDVSGTVTIRGTKNDQIGSVPHISALDFQVFGYAEALIASSQTRWGYYNNLANGHKIVLLDTFFTDRVTHEIQKRVFPFDINAIAYPPSYASAYGPQVLKGNADLTNTTPPVFNNFTVSLIKNTNLIVDIVARATGNGVWYGGSERGMKTDRVENGNGTITLIPFPDEYYSESLYVWVNDANGNSTRALMTVQVGSSTYTLKCV